jgi:hypothetical protein
MGAALTTEKLIALRKLTRALADHLRGQLKDHLAALLPLLRPRTLLGAYTQGGGKESDKSADKAFYELTALYQTVASSKPYNLTSELKSPVRVASSTLEVHPVQYNYVATSKAVTKTLLMTSPLKWVLCYAGYPLARLTELVAARTQKPFVRSDMVDPTAEELEEFVLHFSIIQVALLNQPGIRRILEGLHFPIISGQMPGLGQLPVITISSPVTTVRYPDDVIIESTEISGRDEFDEVVDLNSILTLQDPFKDRLMQLVKAQGAGLLPK